MKSNILFDYSFKYNSNQSLYSKIRFLCLSLVLLICMNCIQTILTNPADLNPTLCADGLRPFIYSVEPYNESSGLKLIVSDPVDDEYYEVSFGYFDYNWLPYFGHNSLTKIKKPKFNSLIGTISKRVNISNTNEDFFKYQIQFKDFFFFKRFASSDNAIFLGYANELIGCPQIICLHSKFDAILFDENTNKFNLFRGYYYYEVSFDEEISLNEVKYIESNFIGVPSNLDSATYFQSLASDFSPFYIFSKGEQIYFYKKELGFARMMHQKNIFSNSKTMKQNFYIDTMTVLSEMNFLISSQGTFIQYKPTKTNNRFVNFDIIFDAYKIFSVENHIENSDDIVAVHDRNEIFFFNNNRIYIHNLVDFIKKTQSIYKNTLEFGEIVDSHHFYKLFKCPKKYIHQLTNDDSEFEKFFMEKLNSKHSIREWNKMNTSPILGYDPILLFIGIGILIAFLTVGYLIASFFLTIYCKFSVKHFSKKKSTKLSQPSINLSQLSQASSMSNINDSNVSNMSGMSNVSKLSNVSQLSSEYTKSNLSSVSNVSSVSAAPSSAVSTSAISSTNDVSNSDISKVSVKKKINLKKKGHKQ